MPDLKVIIGGRNYNVSCNPGEEEAAQESAQLLDQQAELIQDQLGRLAEDKMLLLSGLLLGDKIRALKLERNALEETLRLTQSKLNELTSKSVDSVTSSSETQSADDKTSKEKNSNIILLKNISDLLDGVIQHLHKPNFNDKSQSSQKEIEESTQKSFL